MRFPGPVAVLLLGWCAATALVAQGTGESGSREESLTAAVEGARTTIETAEASEEPLSEARVEEVESAAGALRRSLMFESSAPEDTRLLLGRAYELLDRYGEAYAQYGEYLDRHPRGKSAPVARELRRALRERIDVRLLEGEIEPPIRQHSPQPPYPEAARGRGVEGTVTISAVIDVVGRVTEPRVISSPDPDLSQAALDVVDQWQFFPARGPDGRPVAASYLITFDFKLPR